jgi:hypothetical protein
MRVEQSQQAEAMKAQAGLASAVVNDTAKIPFASVLAKTTTKANTGTGGSNTSPTAEPNTSKKSGKLDASDKADKSAPKGEKTQAVKDHPAYVEITAGPRNGMFINKTNNERSGEAFVMVRKDDRDLHIYGTGKDRRVIISWHKDQPAHADEYRADGTKKSEKSSAPARGGATAPTA